MGNSLTARRIHNPVSSLYKLDVSHVVGGGDLEVIEERIISIGKKQADSFLHKLIEAVKASSLGKKLELDGLSDIEAVNKIKASLPNPGKNSKTFSDSSHVSVCKALAAIVNNMFSNLDSSGKDLIPVDEMEPEEICNRVSEIIHSFGNDVGLEFLQFHNNLKKNLSHIGALSDLMTKYIDELKKEVGDGSSPKSSELRITITSLENVLQMLKQKHLILHNYLNVEYSKEFDSLVELVGDSKTLKQFNASIGTKEFSSKLGSTVGRMVETIEMAGRWKKLLAALDNSVDLDDYAKLMEKVREHKRKLEGKELVKFTELASLVPNIVKAYTGNEAQFKAILEKIKPVKEAKVLGGGCNCGGSCIKCCKLGGEHEVSGGSDEVDKWLTELESDDVKDKFETSEEQKKKSRQIIFDDFVDQLGDKHDELVKAVNALALKINSETVYSEKFMDLKTNLIELVNSDGDKIEFDLIGYNTTADSTNNRNKFLSNLKFIKAVSLELAKIVKSGPECAKLANIAGEFVDLVEDYYKKITKLTGNYAFEVKQNIKRPIKISSLREAVNAFDKNHYLAHVYENMKRSHKSIREEGKNYVELLGKSIASEIAVLTKEKEKISNILDDDNSEFVRAFKVKFSPDKLKEHKKLIMKEYNVKIEFYKAVQFIDLYLKSFTLEVTSKPSSIQELKSLLDGTNVIELWYTKETEDSANTIHNVVDTFNNRPTVSAPNDEYLKIDPVEKKLLTLYDSFMLFKNLLNTFMRVGSFGSSDTDGYMGATKIYKIFMDYMNRSAYSVNTNAILDYKVSKGFNQKDRNLCNIQLNTIGYRKTSNLISGGTVGIDGKIESSYNDETNAITSYFTRADISITATKGLRLLETIKGTLSLKNIKMPTISHGTEDILMLFQFAGCAVKNTDEFNAVNNSLFEQFRLEMTKLAIWQNVAITGKNQIAPIIGTICSAIGNSKMSKNAFDLILANYPYFDFRFAYPDSFAVDASGDYTADLIVAFCTKLEADVHKKITEAEKHVALLMATIDQDIQAIETAVGIKTDSNKQFAERFIEILVAIHNAKKEMVSPDCTNELSRKINLKEIADIIIKHKASKNPPANPPGTVVPIAIPAFNKTTSAAKFDKEVVEFILALTSNGVNGNIVSAIDTHLKKLAITDEASNNLANTELNRIKTGINDVNTLITSLASVGLNDNAYLKAVFDKFLENKPLSKEIEDLRIISLIRQSKLKLSDRFYKELCDNLTTADGKNARDTLAVLSSLTSYASFNVAEFDNMQEIVDYRDGDLTTLNEMASRMGITPTQTEDEVTEVINIHYAEKLNNIAHVISVKVSWVEVLKGANVIQTEKDAIVRFNETIKGVQKNTQESSKYIDEITRMLLGDPNLIDMSEIKKNMKKFRKADPNSVFVLSEVSKLESSIADLDTEIKSNSKSASKLKNKIEKIKNNIDQIELDLFTTNELLEGTRDELERQLKSEINRLSAYPSKYELIDESKEQTEVYSHKFMSSNFRQTDRLFHAVIKAMIAKVITYVSVSIIRSEDIATSVLNSQIAKYDYNEPATRLITVAGGGDSTVEIISDASDLYFRLVRLAEYYRTLFGPVNGPVAEIDYHDLTDDKTKAANSRMLSRQIAMIPEIGGVFSKFIDLIFFKYEAIADGNYSEDECAEIIESINKIYNHYKDSENEDKLCIKIINEFVLEINRRYGIIKGSHLTKYISNLTSVDENNSSTYKTKNNYSILPDEDSKGVDLSRSPSDQYSVVSSVKTNLKSKGLLDLSSGPFGRIEYLEDERRASGIKKMVREFNLKVINGMKSSNIEPGKYSNKIKLYKELIKSDPNNSMKYAVKLIKSEEDVKVFNYQSLMFNETCIVGVDTLEYMITVISNINNVAQGFEISTIEQEKNYLIDQLIIFINKDSNKDERLADLGAVAARLIDITGLNAVRSANTTYTYKEMTELRDRFLSDRFRETYADQTIIGRGGATIQVPSTNGINKQDYDAHVNGMTRVNKAYSHEDLLDILTQLDGDLISLKLNKTAPLVDIRFDKFKKVFDHISSQVKTYLDVFRAHMKIKVTNCESKLNHFVSIYNGYFGKKKQITEVIRNLNRLFSPISASIDAANVCTLIPDQAKIPIDNNITGIGLLIFNRPLLEDTSKNQYTMSTYDFNSEHHSLLYVFNKLLRNYLETFVDYPGQKIYNGLISGYVNGIGSTVVNNPSLGCNDTTAAIQTDINSNILFSSTGYILQRLTKDTTKQIPTYLINTLSDVPLYMKESYRCNLPNYVRMLELLINRAKRTKEIINKLNGYFSFVDISEELCNDYINNIIDHVSALYECAIEVLNELADNSNFMDISMNSTANYVSKYSKYPLTPFSMVTNLYSTTDINLDLKPTDASSTNKSRFLYGIKGIMYGKNAIGNSPDLTLDKIEGIKIIVDNYNSQSDKQNNINVNDYVDFLNNLNIVVKYTINNRFLKKYTHNTNISVMEAVTNENVSVLVNSISNIRIVIDENQSDHLDHIVGNRPTVIDRSVENNSNIRELNIVPINIHALMKTVPLVNIYNYEFIFDYLVYKNEKFTSEFDQYCMIRDRQHIKYLMLDPYAYVDVSPGGNFPDLPEYKMLNKIKGLNTTTTLYRNLVFMVMATNFLKQTLYNKLVLSRNLVDSESHSLLRPEDIQLAKFPHVNGQRMQNEPDYFNKRRFENYDDTDDEI